MQILKSTKQIKKLSIYETNKSLFNVKYMKFPMIETTSISGFFAINFYKLWEKELK